MQPIIVYQFFRYSAFRGMDSKYKGSGGSGYYACFLVIGNRELKLQGYYPYLSAYYDDYPQNGIDPLPKFIPMEEWFAETTIN